MTMTKTKKRILFVGEASFLSTGFSTYYRELIPRLLATGKYEVAEIGSYADRNAPGIKSFIKGRWKFYGVQPTTEAEAATFNQPSTHPGDNGQCINQFGANIFDKVCAEFKPDICIDIRDNWMLSWQLRSPFRPWMKVVWMPTVDAEPQREEWIKDYEAADMILAYSDYGIHALKRQSPKMRIFPKAMRPGVDLKTFRLLPHGDNRDKFGLSHKLPIIGTVMRNQGRKLYPDLIDAFAHMKNVFKGEHAVDKAALLIHSIYPDNITSFDYPRHIMRLHSYEWMDYHHKGLKNDVLQTLMCHNPACRKNSIGYAMNLHLRPVQKVGKFNLALLPCPHCGNNTASGPTTGEGFTREEMAEIFNLMDLYVQCSICEGDGMPIQEAKACGVPSLVMDYTAMREKGRFPDDYEHFKKIDITPENYTCHKGGDVIKVGRYYYEGDTSCKRALPDVDDLALKMRDIITNPERIKKMSEEARECVEINYDWEELWKQWDFVLDRIKIKDRSQTWDTPIIVKAEPNPDTIPDNSTDDETFIEWLYLNILKYPTVDDAGAKHWLLQLKQGGTREQLYDFFVQEASKQVNSENTRQKIRAEAAEVTGDKYTVEGGAEDGGGWI